MPRKLMPHILSPHLNWRTIAALLMGSTGFYPAAHADTAAPSPPPGGFWSLQLENDVWGSGDDRFYSHGTQISYLRRGAPPNWLRTTAKQLPFFDLGNAQAVQFSIGQKIFTPEDTETTVLLLDDRPYAGWLFGSAEVLGLIHEDDNHRVGNLFGITLGIVGPAALGEDIQNSFHDLIGVDRAEGWDNQLENEPGIVINYARRWQYFQPAFRNTEFETSPHITAALGNIYTYAGGGLMLRWGRGLRNDFSPPNIRPGFPGIPYLRPSKQPSWYLFAGVEGRAVARNIFLDGNTFEDSHSVDKEPLVADFQFGVAWQWEGVRIALSNVWRTREFDGQDENTQFGAINVSFYLPD